MTASAKDPPGEPKDDEATIGRNVYRWALAGVGVLVQAQEEVEALLRRLVDRTPAQAAPSATPPAPPPVPAGASAEKGGRTAFAEQIDGTIGRVLRSFNVPTRTDVDRLARKIEELAAKVDSLGPR